MIVRPDLQCESPYFHGLWYFYLTELCLKLWLHHFNPFKDLSKINHACRNWPLLKTIILSTGHLVITHIWWPCGGLTTTLKNGHVSSTHRVWVLFGVFFMFYWLDLHDKICVAWAHLLWSINKNRIENQTSHDLVTVFGRVHLLIIYWKYVGSPNCADYWVWSSPISSKHVSCMVFVIWSSSYYTPIKYRGLCKKTTK